MSLCMIKAIIIIIGNNSLYVLRFAVCGYSSLFFNVSVTVVQINVRGGVSLYFRLATDVAT